MGEIAFDITGTVAVVSVLVAILAGVIKGMVGFSMPMIFLIGLSFVVPPDWALAGLIVPMLVTNVWQALMQGGLAACDSIHRFRVFLACGVVALLISAQFVRAVSDAALFVTIGGIVTLFALMQLMGLQMRIAGPDRRIEAGLGLSAGVLAGFTGIWGPPTILYLTAIDTPRLEQIRVLGVVFALGTVALAVAHLGSGILRAETALFSLSLLPPALLGMWVGNRMGSRIDHAAFRKATLLVLLVAGVNLIRRGLSD